MKSACLHSASRHFSFTCFSRGSHLLHTSPCSATQHMGVLRCGLFRGQICAGHLKPTLFGTRVPYQSLIKAKGSYTRSKVISMNGCGGDTAPTTQAAKCLLKSHPERVPKPSRKNQVKNWRIRELENANVVGTVSSPYPSRKIARKGQKGNQTAVGTGERKYAAWARRMRWGHRTYYASS